MARIFQTGYEMNSTGVGDIVAASAIQTDQTRGSWSTYSGRGGTYSWDASVSEFYFGFGFRNATGTLTLAEFKSPNGTTNVSVVHNATAARMEIRRGTSTVLATGTTVISSSVWYYVEGHFVINDSTGQYELKLNGAVDITAASSQDTRNDAGANGDKCDRITIVNDANVRFDDILVNDTTTSYNAGYAGDTRISAYVPNAAGDVTGLTRGGTDSGNNYGQVDERPPNDGTDYVFGTDTTSYDLYNIPNTSGVATVQAVTLWVRAAKSDAGAASIAHALKSGGVEDFGSDVALSTSYAYYRKNYNIDPTDSAAWSPSKLDGLQVGIKSR